MLFPRSRHLSVGKQHSTSELTALYGCHTAAFRHLSRSSPHTTIIKWLHGHFTCCCCCYLLSVKRVAPHNGQVTKRRKCSKTQVFHKKRLLRIGLLSPQISFFILSFTAGFSLLKNVCISYISD